MNKQTIRRVAIEGGILCALTFAATFFAPVSMAEVTAHKALAEVLTTAFTVAVSILLVLRPDSRSSEVSSGESVGVSRRVASAI